jgi:hypothetical protein
MKKEYRCERFYCNISKHGKNYVPDFGVCCPECSSFSISTVNENDTLHDNIEDCEFLCKECGCKFNVYVDHVLTESGRRLKVVFNTIIALMSALTAVFLISGVCFAIAHKILGFVFIGVSVVTGIAATAISEINDDI